MTSTNKNQVSEGASQFCRIFVFPLCLIFGWMKNYSS